MKNLAYVDGSFNDKTKVYGYGAILYDQVGKMYILSGSASNPDVATMRNVAGEILGAKTVIKKAVDLGMKILTLYYDYEGIANWPLKRWKTNKKWTTSYARFVRHMMSKGLDIIFEKVVAHSGDVGNDAADRLAKKAVGLL